MKKVLLFTFFSFVMIVANSQVVTPDFGIKFSGFVKYDAFYDTRQTVNIREGHFVLYPDNILLDALGNDINASPSINMLSIQTRLKGAITGPDAFGAKTSGIIEADFFGNENANFSDVNGFRLRHAIIKLSWDKTEIIAGQYWNPFFVTDVFPGVITFNTGAPFNPFSRNPQFRLTQKLGALSIILAAYTQRDFSSTGPGGSSSIYLRNSGIPTGHIQFQLKPGVGDHIFGIGADYKILKPRLYNEITYTDTMVINGATYLPGVKVKYQVNETVSAFSAFGYAKLKFEPVTIKLYGIYAQNATDLTMIGGYAVKEITNTQTGECDYLPLTTASAWTEIISNGKKVQVGVFAGYTKNMGATDSIAGKFYARGSNIDYVYRISPRIVFINEKLSIALEPEYTSALYGKENGNGKGLPTDAKAVNNLRMLFSMTYNF